MLGTQDFWMFVVAGLLLNMTPGADTLYIVGKAASGGVKSGAAAAIGIGAGCLVHTAFATFGLAALMASSSTAYLWIKGLGAAYLFYMGVTMLLSRSTSTSNASSHSGHIKNSSALPSTVLNPKELLQKESLLKIFWGGFFTNALNPKVALFFLAFLPQFVATNSPHPSFTMLFLGLVFAVNGTIWNVGVAWSSSFLSKQLKTSETVSLWLKRSCGALFVYFGIKLLRS